MTSDGATNAAPTEAGEEKQKCISQVVDKTEPVDSESTCAASTKEEVQEEQLEKNADVVSTADSTSAGANHASTVSSLSTHTDFKAAIVRLVVDSSSGDMRDGVLEGQVRIQFKNGNVYTGEAQSGLMHGQGRLEWTDGTVFQGRFVEQEITGRGQYVWPDGSSYEGDVVQGIRHGEGTYKNPTLGCEFIGEWRNGLRHGTGTLFYNAERTSYYKGTFVDGKRHGHGRVVYKSGSVYDGSWEDDKKSG